MAGWTTPPGSSEEIPKGGSLILLPEYTPDTALITIMLSHCLRIIPNIEELHLVEWTVDDMRA